MMTLLAATIMVGIALSGLVALVPFAAVGLVVFGLAAFAMELGRAVLVFACLQAGFVAGLCLRALLGRFRAAAALRRAPDRSPEAGQAPLQAQEWQAQEWRP